MIDKLLELYPNGFMVLPDQTIKPLSPYESRVETLAALYQRLKSEINSCYLRWEYWDTVYNILFKEIKPQIDKILPVVYCDPDEGYDDDVLAYYNALTYHIDLSFSQSDRARITGE